MISVLNEPRSWGDEASAAILDMEARIRPKFLAVRTATDIDMVFAYHTCMQRAFESRGLVFKVPAPEARDAKAAALTLQLTKLEVERLKVSGAAKATLSDFIDASVSPWHETIIRLLEEAAQITHDGFMAPSVKLSLKTRLDAARAELERHRRGRDSELTQLDGRLPDKSARPV